MMILPLKSDFQNWRNPRRGKSNPERMNNPFWDFCIRTGSSAYEVNKELDGPDSFNSGPCWCFDRFGQSHITLPDGRELFIGGEHEDWYDPDFYIYNDVIIVDKDYIEIFGYPVSVFPPTDFHSATLVGTNVFLIGNLGYQNERRIGQTQVLRLDIESLQISIQQTSGENPGWIFQHSAVYDEPNNSIRVSGGKQYDEEVKENYNDYYLCLKTFKWRLYREKEVQILNLSRSRWRQSSEDLISNHSL